MLEKVLSIKKLNYKQLKNFYSIESIKNLEDSIINNTENNAKNNAENNAEDNNINIIGQENAIENLKFGLGIKNKAYNIYVSGSTGSGKTTFSKHFAQEFAKTQKTPDDIVYVYNFKNPKSPTVLYLDAGQGKIFKNDIEDFIYMLSVEIPSILLSSEHEEQKDEIIKSYNQQRDAIIKEITRYAKTKDLGVKNSNNGIYFMPIIDGVTISDEEYDDLDEDEKDEIDKAIDSFQEDANKVIKVLRDLDKEVKTKLENIEYNLTLLTVGNYINPLQSKYLNNSSDKTKENNNNNNNNNKNLKIISYLNDLKEDILNNISSFMTDSTEEDEVISSIIPIHKKTYEENFAKYNVNLLVDNSETIGAPVITDYSPTYTNLIGETEFESELGNLTTDYMKIKAGLFHKANGGYLILHIEDILKNNFSLETIMKVIKTQKVTIEPLKDYQVSAVSLCSINPQPIDVNIKFILIGSAHYYDIISDHEENFEKFFKIHSIFDYEMDNNKGNIIKIIKFIKDYQVKNNLLEFDTSAILEIIQYITRLSGTKNKFTTQFDLITELLIEANAWALIDKLIIIDDLCIKKTIKQKLKFSGIYKEKLQEMILSNDILIKTNGLAVGEINGLSVLDYGNYSFGKPSKITVTTYKSNSSKSGIVDIERESDLSGDIHTKGIQVITGYLGKTYARNFPLNFSCRICFEQNYHGVDGDSASSTELYAIISSLSGIPLKQGIAVTGSVNQMGKIQPIGGVNEKIEGFFEVCIKKGLDYHEQGVIIPVQNVKDLCLNEEVIEAVKNNKFSIYPVSTIDEGIEILTGYRAGKLLKNNKFEKGSIHDLALQKIELFSKKI